MLYYFYFDKKNILLLLFRYDSVTRAREGGDTKQVPPDPSKLPMLPASVSSHTKDTTNSPLNYSINQSVNHTFVFAFKGLYEN